MIAYVAPSVVAIGVTGSLVSKFGYYVGLRIFSKSTQSWKAK
jgi:hypothetical protein